MPLANNNIIKPGQASRSRSQQSQKERFCNQNTMSKFFREPVGQLQLKLRFSNTVSVIVVKEFMTR